MPTVTINNQVVEVEPGKTLLQAARQIGIEIPTLCYWEGVRPMNSCMLCTVRNTETGQLHSSCSTLAQEGMKIETDTGDVCEARKEVLELILSEHIGDCEAPCAHTCPASMNIPVMMRQIYEGEFDDAAYTIHNGLVIPWTLGHVCPAPCENPCRRKSYDETMKIRMLHRNVAEKSLQQNPELLECPPDTGKRVAVIGAGATGLAAAWVLRKLGHAVTMYEKDEKAGGKLRDWDKDKLPLEVLDTEIAFITRLGIDFRYSTRVDEEMLEALKEDYDAVILACTSLGKAAGKVFLAKEHKLTVMAVGNGKTTAAWVDRYMTSVNPQPDKELFESRIGKLVKAEMEEMRDHNENNEAMLVKPILAEEPLADSRKEAGRCLHCDCRKRVSCTLRKWSHEYGAEQRKYNTTETKEVRFVGLGGDVYLEPGKCIRCGLCVEIARMHGEEIGLAFSGRGFEMEIKVPFERSLDEGLRKSAAECVRACPTAAIAFRNKEDIENCHTTIWIEL